MSTCRVVRQRGIALILVLWIITLLSLIALSFIATMRSEINIVANTMNRARAEAAANAGIQRALFELARPPNAEGRWIADGTAQTLNYQDASIRIVMTDETARIDINTANPELLRGLFLSQGLSADGAAALTDAIADWKDPDTLKRLNGAEEPEYIAAGLSYKPANAPFQSIEELNCVLGMTAALYARIAPLITVYSRQPGIYAQIAPREVLRAIPNVNDEQIELYLQQRDLARAGNAALPNFTPGTAYLSAGSGYVVRVQAEAILPDGTHFTREAVARPLGNPRRPFTFLLWKEGRETLPPADIAAGRWTDAKAGPKAEGDVPAASDTTGQVR
ncbi:MAG TPA: hypothetical protein VF928_00050 [Usitatibacteraceae bacterium]